MDTETGDEVRRHSDLWLEDGSVICRAENVLFCVHMSQLARHSLVFHDMFMLPQPEASDLEPPFLSKADMSRRVPLVYLYDKAEDVANLLTALYDGPYVLFNSSHLVLQPQYMRSLDSVDVSGIMTKMTFALFREYCDFLPSILLIPCVQRR